jgi:ribosomal protein S18 acetylase RimI-like enzyme
MIRRVRPSETDQIALIWHRSGLDEYDYLPRFQKLDGTKAKEIFREVILPKNELWIEEKESIARGFMALNDSYIDRLYVDPIYQRYGVGSALMRHAKSPFLSGLRLHTHQQNSRARRFYEKHGFAAVGFGISPAPEFVPDVEYHWVPDR